MRIEEQPVTGWEHDVDVADTLLRRFVHHLAALDAAFTLAGCGRTLDADDVSMADLGRPGGSFNGAVLLRPPTDWPDALARIERFAAPGRGRFCLWSAWPTPDLHDRGWQLSGHPTLFIRPPCSVAPLGGSGRPPLEFRRVLTPADLVAWERAAIDSYPFASPALLDDDRLRLFIGWAGADAVAATASFASHGIASFALDASAPAAIACLETTPDLWFAGVLSDHSRTAAEALGFVPLLRLTVWILRRP